MKKTLNKTIRISFQEKNQSGFVNKSFDTYKEHLAFHLQQMKKSPDARRLGILPSPCYQGCFV